MKLFTPTQIDQILEKVAQQNPKNDFNAYRNFLLDLDPLGKPDDLPTIPRRKASN